MKISYVNYKAQILVGDYQFADSLKDEVVSLLQTATNIGHTNVKAFHAEWDWEPNNIKIRNLKGYIKEEIERAMKPGACIDSRVFLRVDQFWANVYKKGDYAQSHDHRPFDWSFAYFVKAKWYDSPLIFTESGKRIRPKEGRFVAFPSFLEHRVPKHRYNDTRITLSGNLDIDMSRTGLKYQSAVLFLDKQKQK